jgi:RNA polymerase sigma-70 factor (ECF subfamily)
MRAPAAATVGGDQEFVRVAEQFRRELIAHCYRMVGSIDDAEELVQETYLRAWRSYEGFEHRSSVRAWLYRIATNICLTALRRPVRRVLPSGLVGPSDDPDAPTVLAGPEVAWLQPFPDSLAAAAETDDPASVAAARASVRLALIASLQYLPPRQRAVFILRDVLGFSAPEVAQMLDTSTPAVKSSLQRARARLEQARPSAEELSEPTDRQAKELLEQYMLAFEQSDPAALERVLRDDATLEVTTATTWFAGKRNCMRYIRQFAGSPGEWKMVPTSANGQPAVAAYHRDETGNYLAFAIVILTISSDQIAGITLFSDPALFKRFEPAPG